jgi:hypothetical protein
LEVFAFTVGEGVVHAVHGHPGDAPPSLASMPQTVSAYSSAFEDLEAAVVEKAVEREADPDGRGQPVEDEEHSPPVQENIDGLSAQQRSPGGCAPK